MHVKSLNVSSVQWITWDGENFQLNWGLLVVWLQENVAFSLFKSPWLTLNCQMQKQFEDLRG